MTSFYDARMTQSWINQFFVHLLFDLYPSHVITHALFFSPLHTHSPGVAQRNHSLPLSSSTGAEGCFTSWSRAPQQDMREGRLYSLFIFNCCFLRWSRNWNLSPSDNKPIFTVWPHNARLSLLLDDSASYLRFCGTNQLHIYSCSLMSVGH